LCYSRPAPCLPLQGPVMSRETVKFVHQTGMNGQTRIPDTLNSTLAPVNESNSGLFTLLQDQHRITFERLQAMENTLLVSAEKSVSATMELHKKFEAQFNTVSHVMNNMRAQMDTLKTELGKVTQGVQKLSGLEQELEKVNSVIAELAERSADPMADSGVC
jgi:methyl-accepting chemotaxis protein